MRPPVRALVLGGEEGPATGLVEALGAERASAVRELLLQRARAWALDAFGPDAVRLVADGSFAAALGDAGSHDADSGEGGSADANSTDVGSAGDGSAGAGAIVVVRPEIPRWHPELAIDALGDLEAGCALSLAPVLDGDLYLLAVAGPLADRLAELATLDLAGPSATSRLFARSQRERWDVGLLRAERGLRRARDLRALLADPITDPELRTLLR